VVLVNHQEATVQNLIADDLNLTEVKFLHWFALVRLLWEKSLTLYGVFFLANEELSNIGDLNLAFLSRIWREQSHT